MTQFYRKNGIKSFLNSPCKDLHEDEYAEHLFKAVCVLGSMINDKGYIVFMHDTCGVSRCTTLFIIYLALFIKHSKWNNLPELEKFAKSKYPEGVPNMEMVKRVVDENKDFQNLQLRKLKEDEENKHRNKAEADRQQQLQNANDEAERIRLLRLAEQEAEKLRLQRAQFEEAERSR